MLLRTRRSVGELQLGDLTDDHFPNPTLKPTRVGLSIRSNASIALAVQVPNSLL